MKISMIIMAVSLGCVSADCTSSFDQLTTQGPCPESNLLLECSAERTLLTVFRGSLLNCSNTNNEITLLHSRFNTTSGTNGTCNNGRILGYSLPDNTSSNCYISQLCITVTPDIIGKTIECAYDNGTTEIIGSYLIGETQCYTTTFTTITPSTATKSLSTGEATAIVLCCSAFIVGIIITVIILLIFGFILKKKQLQASQTPNSAPVIQEEDDPTATLNANMRQKTQATFQNDEVSGYTLCTTDYDRIVIINDDGEYSHLQYPGP